MDNKKRWYFFVAIQLEIEHQNHENAIYFDHLFCLIQQVKHQTKKQPKGTSIVSIPFFFVGAFDISDCGLITKESNHVSFVRKKQWIPYRFPIVFDRNGILQYYHNTSNSICNLYWPFHNFQTNPFMGIFFIFPLHKHCFWVLVQGTSARTNRIARVKLKWVPPPWLLHFELKSPGILEVFSSQFERRRLETDWATCKINVFFLAKIVSDVICCLMTSPIGSMYGILTYIFTMKINKM